MLDHIFHELSAIYPALILLVFFDAARFENQCWVKARMGGFKGSNEEIGFFVDLTGFLANIFYWSFLFSVGYDHGVGVAIFIFVTFMLIGLISTAISTKLFKGNNPIAWILSTIILYPLCFLIAPYTSWFGLFALRHP